MSAVTRNLPYRFFSLLAGLKLAFVLIAALLLILTLEAQQLLDTLWPRSLILIGLGINLAVSLIVRRRLFLRRKALLFFHVGLLVMGGLGIWGALVYEEVGFEITEGQRIRLTTKKAKTGPLSVGRLAASSIRAESLETLFWRADDLKMSEAKLTLQQEESSLSLVARPNDPARYGGVRIFLLPARGYSAFLGFQDKQGALEKAYLNFPEFRKNPTSQMKRFGVPGLGANVRARLIVQGVYQPDGPWSLASPDEAELELYDEKDQYLGTLSSPGRLDVEGGSFFLREIKPWALLLVRYDPSERWLGVTGMFLALSMIADYFWGRRPKQSGA